MKPKRIKLIFTFQLVTIAILIIVATILIVSDFFTYKAEFAEQADLLQTNHTVRQKELIKREVMRAATIVKEYQSYAEVESKRLVKERINTAITLAQKIYLNNKDTKSNDEIQQMIVETLREIRFTGSNGYYFIAKLDAKVVLFADHPELEGTSLRSTQDSTGKFVVSEMIDIVKKSGSGFCEYYWTKPGATGNNHHKISYVQLFEPLNWFVGTGLYVEDIEARIKKKVLSSLSKIHFGKSGYLFIDGYDGSAFVTSGKVFPGNQKVWELYNTNPDAIKLAYKQALEATTKPEGGYVYYTIRKSTDQGKSFQKVSYIYGIPEWQWFIGAGVYLDEVEAQIVILQKQLQEKHQAQMKKTIIVTGFSILLAIGIFYLVSRRLNRDMALFINFFDKVAYDDLQIDTSKIYFDGLVQIAERANVVLHDKKVASKKVLESEERFRNMADLLPEAIFETNLEMILTYGNKRSYELFGYTEADLAKELKSVNMFAPEEKNKMLENAAAQFSGQKRSSTEYLSVKKDGTTFPTLLHVSPIMKEGKPCGLRGIVIDLTEHKLAEEEVLKLRKLESIGVLAGGIAHDFNNLLAGLFGNIEMAKRFLDDDSKSIKYLKSAGLSMERAISLTQQLLTFAKGGEPIKETLSVANIINETAEFSVRGSSTKLDLKIDSDLWLVNADKGQLGQVISNLVINGKQAMPNGGILTIGAKNVVTVAENLVQITVRDHGPGIAPENIDKIFDPYFSTKRQGNGLGLASCYSIITKHNGTISVNSKLNQGSTFTITLPATKGYAKQSEETITHELNNNSHTVANILILEDEELVQLVSSAMLTEMGHQIDLANHGEEAVEKYRLAQEQNNGYDVVICDLTIPGGMGGKEAAEKIIDIHQQAKLIVSSGYSNDPIMANYEEYGFVGRVAKPYRFTELQREIERIVEL